MIERIGRTWYLFSRQGKVLGTHPSKASAERQERAIQISKARASGYLIPKPNPKRRR